jgi:hypothetical protein
MGGWMLGSKEAQGTTITRFPPLPAPGDVRKTLRRRQRIQVIRLRTTIADGVPGS